MASALENCRASAELVISDGVPVPVELVVKIGSDQGLRHTGKLGYLHHAGYVKDNGMLGRSDGIQFCVMDTLAPSACLVRCASGVRLAGQLAALQWGRTKNFPSNYSNSRSACGFRQILVP